MRDVIFELYQEANPREIDAVMQAQRSASPSVQARESGPANHWGTKPDGPRLIAIAPYRALRFGTPPAGVEVSRNQTSHRQPFDRCGNLSDFASSAPSAEPRLVDLLLLASYNI